MSIKIKEVRKGVWSYHLYFRWPSRNQFLERARVPVPGLTRSRALTWVEDRRNELLRQGEDAHTAKRAVKPDPVPNFDTFGPRYVKEWLLVEDYSERTRGEYQRLLGTDIYPRFGYMRLDALGLSDIQKLKGDYLSEEIAKKTINNVLTVLSQVLKYAKKIGILANPPPEIEHFKSVEPEMERYSDDVYASIVEAAADVGPRYLTMVLLGGDAGLRRGELVGLEWSDVDLERKVLHVKRQESRGKVGLPKGGKFRSIPLSDRLCDALKELRKRRSTTERRVLARDPSYSWDRKQGRVKDRTLQNWMELIEKRAGIEGGTGRLHILRHTFCSRLAEAGAAVGHIQKLAGHASITTTMRYMHYSDEGKAQAIALLNGPLSRNPVQKDEPGADLQKVGTPAG